MFIQVTTFMMPYFLRVRKKNILKKINQKPKRCIKSSTKRELELKQIVHAECIRVMRKSGNNGHSAGRKLHISEIYKSKT